MKKILVLGAGRSSTVMIHYLARHAADWNADVTIGDQQVEQARAKAGNHAHVSVMAFDANDETQRKEVIGMHDFVISMLPPALHILVARDCLALKKHLITASYVSHEMQALNEDAKKSGLLFMCEMGLDPGIDHMSAMREIHQIQNEGGVITSFKSGTGGLVAPESDDNPWHYKVTWNPRNVVLAGQGAAQYLENGRKKFVPYHRIFTTTEKFSVNGYGKFEAYPNRDSLQYITKYQLEGVQTIIRSTLRKQGYCEAWNALVQLGVTDDQYTIENASQLSYAQWTSACLPESKKHHDSNVKARTAKFLGLKKHDEVMERLEWLGLFSDEKIPLDYASPALILQRLIEKKWQMQPHDNDLIIMRHEFIYNLDQNSHTHVSTLALKGDDAMNTAMAKTVGLPLALMAKLMIEQDVFLTGVHIPVMSQVYEPVLNELETLGVHFERNTQRAEAVS